MKNHEVDPTLTILQYVALIHQVSYTNVCKAVGLTPQQFSDWVKKRRPVPRERLQLIADYFHIEADWLVDGNYYLRDLTPEAKADVQILFLQQQLDRDGQEADAEAYEEKLARLQQEKRNHALVARLTAIIQQEDERVYQVCDAFLSRLEQGNLEELELLWKERRSPS
ncbi:helix-turn-helix transcriptional regulator [Paenibacillus filicis]|uniref:Helix-turn-helix transcriptional regulator n=1 Tax=Paenibacillus filicis TaxID=669464 RepID=A0ABU9DJL9_9BACL